MRSLWLVVFLLLSACQYSTVIEPQPHLPAEATNNAAPSQKLDSFALLERHHLVQVLQDIPARILHLKQADGGILFWIISEQGHLEVFQLKNGNIVLGSVPENLPVLPPESSAWPLLMRSVDFQVQKGFLYLPWESGGIALEPHTGYLQRFPQRQSYFLSKESLPDAELTLFEENLLLLEAPTERYGHGILGDRLEASGLGMYSLENGKKQAEIVLPETEVFETLRPLRAELVSESDRAEIIMTVSDKNKGSFLRIYSANGAELAVGAEIGSAFRWLHLLGVAHFAPDLAAEIAVIKTPHIGGVLELYKLSQGKLVKTVSLKGYSTHRIGSRNLDMFVMFDLNGDHFPELILPHQEMRSLGVLQRNSQGFKEQLQLNLGSPLSTNLAGFSESDQWLLAAGTQKKELHLWFR
ncbi:hypothetical protein COW20_21045 [bacterium (Candidatus Blackallbacteria) CG13_big_fil_rev_8_21_14_2_50_49_14]|nr:MAG: hypothetical protein COW64_00755 [bacterium (Candidatus Blackallbacteria) CG18_big_fil_WC_8_21_14_2_50_49_26]PIW45187.1 MAG: hypothetical protein COW20_21045 [bacterium (Candidatus Blackallbacteria) CG13_big_fil_rev_8_21_14_2_50_49_14]